MGANLAEGHFARTTEYSGGIPTRPIAAHAITKTRLGVTPTPPKNVCIPYLLRLATGRNARL